MSFSRRCLGLCLLGGDARADRVLRAAAALGDRAVGRAAEAARAALDAVHHARVLGGLDVVRVYGLRDESGVQVHRARPEAAPAVDARARRILEDLPP